MGPLNKAVEQKKARGLLLLPNRIGRKNTDRSVTTFRGASNDGNRFVRIHNRVVMQDNKALVTAFWACGADSHGKMLIKKSALLFLFHQSVALLRRQEKVDPNPSNFAISGRRRQGEKTIKRELNQRRINWAHARQNHDSVCQNRLEEEGAANVVNHVLRSKAVFASKF